MNRHHSAMSESLSAIKALSDENRLRAFLALRGGELCVCQIIELLQLAPSTVSKHMSILKQAGLVNSRKCGRWMYYSLPDTHVSPGRQDWIARLSDRLSEDEQIQNDRKQIKNIVRIAPEQLCQIQTERNIA